MRRAAHQLTGEAAAFLKSFRARHGRAPRILHVGNIVNNAYLNATILNRHGFDCDVICEQYHVMSYAEWEHDFTGSIGDQYRPDWTQVERHGPERPRWYAQGPRELAIDYLIARRTGREGLANQLWKELGWINKTRAKRDETNVWLVSQIRIAFERFSQMLSRIRRQPHPHSVLWSKPGLGLATRVFVLPLATVAILIIRLPPRSSRVDQPERAPVVDSGPPPDWPARFAEAFPDRADQLTFTDYATHVSVAVSWKRLFEYYDIVQAYGTEVTWPMLAEKRPYLGFEHGTLREFVLPNDPACRLAALAFHRADQLFITNGDCLEYAHKIDVKSYMPMVHPFDDEAFRRVGEDTKALHAMHGARYLFLCPLRHDWAIKGTDKYIRALPELARAIGRDFRVIMTRYGKQVDDSERLIRELGVEDLIVWSEPFNRVQLIRHMKSVDAVFDQLAVPCFGGTAPQAMAVGVPVVMSFDPSTTEWIIPETPPILSASTVDEIVCAVQKAIDPAWRRTYEMTARRWYTTHHSAAQVLDGHGRAYRDVCEKTGLLP